MINSIRTLFIAILALFSIAVTAHEEIKVVVIPMAGDDVKLEPFAPLASPSPLDSDYTINGNSPSPSDHTVIDKITGLEWQRKDDDIYRLWREAWDYCAGLSLDGKHDWRLPSISELRSIVSHDRFIPAINAVFLNTDNYFYWSATSNSSDAGVAWTIEFAEGNSGGWGKENEGSLPVRCVRSGNPNGPVLRDNEDGTVSDLTTGLIWQQVDDGSERAMAAAQSYCDGLFLGDKGGWRLPNVKELESILDYRLTDLIIDEALFPSTSPSYYWSATDSARVLDSAWRVSFSGGFVSFNSRSITNFVRCVR